MKVNKLKLRIKTAWQILTMKKRHWVFISIDTENLVKQIKDEKYTVDITQHGLRNYNSLAIIRAISKSISDEEFICEKADYEAKAIGYSKNIKTK